MPGGVKCIPRTLLNHLRQCLHPCPSLAARRIRTGLLEQSSTGRRKYHRHFGHEFYRLFMIFEFRARKKRYLKTITKKASAERPCRCCANWPRTGTWDVRPGGR